MPKAINYSFRMDPEMKSEADLLFNELGMSLATALTIFIQQSLRERGIPFKITLRDNEHELDAIMLDAIDAVDGLRKEAKENGLSEQSLDEINAKIKTVRDKRKARDRIA